MIKQSPAKTKRFLKAINNAAMQKCNDIARQIEETTQEAMLIAEEEASREGHIKVDIAKAKIEAAAKAEVAEYEKSKKVEIYKKRNRYCQTVFTEAEEKLHTFTKSDEYASFLKHSIQTVSDKVSENLAICFSVGDTAAKGIARKAFPNAALTEDASIQIGGYIFKDEANHLIFNDTLDTRLAEQLDWFLLNCNLKVE